MRSTTVLCPRCEEAVDELRFVPPDVMSPGVFDEIETYEQALGEDDGLELCSDCLSDIGVD